MPHIPGPSGNNPTLTIVAASAGAYNSAELAVDLIEQQIIANISQALSNVRSYRDDPIVSTEPPREYFQYETAHGYRCPAVFTIIQDMDFREAQQGQNHINASDRIVVAVIVEDQLERNLVKKSWRYQAAMMQCLHHVSLTTADGALRLFSRVKRCEFSGIINLKDDKAPEAVFRQEMSLQLTVDHVEQLR